MGKMKPNPRYNVISMRIDDTEDKFFKDLVGSGRFIDRTAALRHVVEAGMISLKQKGLVSEL